MNHLTNKHGFPLTDVDRRGIEYVYHAFFRFGPAIRYSSTAGFGGSYQPNYRDLMTASDEHGVARGYLASEDAFRFMKDLHSRNMLVPIVGNFTGPKAIRAVASYLKSNGATVSAFYVSNVEQFLYQEGTWSDFCANAATLPLDEASTFIRAVRGNGRGLGYGLNSDIGSMTADLKDCAPVR
jgi:hypothetical protein